MTQTATNSEVQKKLDYMKYLCEDSDSDSDNDDSSVNEDERTAALKKYFLKSNDTRTFHFQTLPRIPEMEEEYLQSVKGAKD